ncbi:MAG: DEAD/DEAH box helicase [Candidatus Obscuribacterales bacterium]|nr:DEAD/DEAH box helicase [Candidatus Obscuribacterales bacterium]
MKFKPGDCFGFFDNRAQAWDNWLNSLESIKKQEKSVSGRLFETEIKEPFIKDEKLINFEQLGLAKPTASLLQKIGFEQPTEIQEKAIPAVLDRKDLMASAQTGSGKTAAFALPIIEKLKPQGNKPQALVLAPTRELAVQIEKEFQRFGQQKNVRVLSVYGGTGYDRQIRLLRRGVDVIVATPGRLFDHIERKTVDLSMIKYLVLDEADRMLDMGFMPQVRRIVAKLSKERQTLMFSATIDKRVEQLASEYLKNPVTVRVNPQQVEAKEIEQCVYHVDESGKEALLLKLLNEEDMKSVLVFTRTRRKAGRIRDRLRQSNVQAEEIHGDISQSQREKTLSRYRAGAFNVLVATDVAARGLDIPSISHVVNYDLPDSAADYVHRIGRTGRAGRTGVALSFVSIEQRYLVRDIEKITGRQLCLPDGSPAVKPPKKSSMRRLSMGGRRR